MDQDKRPLQIGAETTTGTVDRAHLEEMIQRLRARDAIRKTEAEQFADAREYQAQALRTAGKYDDASNDQIIAGVFGLTGEAGEVADGFKKVLFHGHDYDADKVAKELGDVLWYVALLCDAIGTDMAEVMRRNIAKLRARYPEGFSHEASINRAEYAEEPITTRTVAHINMDSNERCDHGKCKRAGVVQCVLCGDVAYCDLHYGKHVAIMHPEGVR